MLCGSPASTSVSGNTARFTICRCLPETDRARPELSVPLACVSALTAGKIVPTLEAASAWILGNPRDLKRSPDGSYPFVSGAGKDRLPLLWPGLEIRRELGRDDCGRGGQPYLGLAADGMLILSDRNNHIARFISADGRLPQVPGAARPGKGPNRFTSLEDLESRSREVRLSDSRNDRVVKYRPKVR